MNGKDFWETWVDEKTVTGERLAERADNEARSRPPRRERPEAPPEEPGFQRLYVNVGKREGLATEDLTKMCSEAMPDVALGRIVVLGTHSYVSVKIEQSDALWFFAPCKISIRGRYSRDVLENTGSVAQVP